MFFIKEWFDADRKNHTAEWGNNILRNIRWNMLPLVNPGEAARGMDYLLGRQDMGFIKDLFLNAARLNLGNEAPSSGIVNTLGRPVSAHGNHDKFMSAEMSAVNFKPLPIMEKLRNILISEPKKMGPVIDIRANDPTSNEHRKNDRGLIENHKDIEHFLSYIYTSIGQQPYKIKSHEDRVGEKPDNGNTQDFHSMGLNPEDPSDVDFFFKFFHKLDQEIAALSPVEYCISYNQIIEKIENWGNDLIAKKAICGRVYVSDVSGSIPWEYAAPETAYIYGGGRRKDYNDANAKVLEQRVTVKQMIDSIGNAFDMEAQWNNLLMAISFTNGVEFTGIQAGYRGWVTADYKLTTASGTVYGYNQFMDFKVVLGYAEWCSQNLDSNAPGVKNDGTFHQNNQPANGERYQVKARYETPTYKCYYLAVSAVDQVMFHYGEQTFQQIEGYSDVISNYTIITLKEIGDPIAIMCIPFLDTIMEAWYKFKYEIRRAKPRGTDYNYDSIIDIAEDVFTDTNMTRADKFTKMIQWLDTSANGVWKVPTIDGKPWMIPNGQLNADKPNGLTPQALDWYKICVDTMAQMLDIVGISPLREGDPGGPRDSMNNQFKALEYSQAATYYIPDMITNMLQQFSTRTLLYVQDIITYKNYNTLAYKFLEDAVGKDVLDKLEGLGKTALHRFGIFVESLNQAPMRAKLDAVLMEAVKNKSISTAEYVLIGDIKSPKKAFQIFAYMEQRNKKIAQQSAMELAKQQQEHEDKQQQMTYAIEKMKIDGMIIGKHIDANAGQQEHLINQEGGITKTKLKISADAEQPYHEAYADFLAQQRLLNDTGKNTAPPIVPQQNIGAPALSATPAPQPSDIQQLKDGTQMMPNQ